MHRCEFRYGSVDHAGDRFSERVSLFRALHKRTDDILRSVSTAEEILLGTRISVAAKYGRMTGMGDEVGQDRSALVDDPAIGAAISRAISMARV